MKRRDFRNRLSYSTVLYNLWWILGTGSATAAIFAGPIFGEWGWSLGFTVGTLAIAAHARLERIDGHTHRNNGIETP